MLKVHERTTSAGELRGVYLTVDRDALWIVDDGESRVLPNGALAAVMARYGAPLDPAEPVNEVGALDLGRGCTLRALRHLGRFDVIARDYLVYASPDAEPRCALAVTVAAALDHLARASDRAG
jgi:hypothetical protein